MNPATAQSLASPSSPAPSTVSPTVFTEEPMIETTEDPILPTIVVDQETARGDSLGRYPSEYKSIIYVEDKSYNKLPSPYKSWEYVNSGKKVAYDKTDGNEVEKSMPVYKVKRFELCERDRWRYISRVQFKCDILYS